MNTLVIAMVNAKGGAGKTTIAWTLATYFDSIGLTVLLIDTDPQSTLVTFYGVRQGKGKMEVIALNPAALERRVARERGHFDIIIIDTPGRLDELKPSIKTADIIVMPIQPSGADYFSFQRIYEACKGRKVLIAPNRVKSGREVDECVQTVRVMTHDQAIIASVPWGDRVSYRNGTKDGMSLIDLESRYSDGYKEVKSLAEQIIAATQKEVDHG